MLLLALISALTLFCTGNCLLFWKEYALTERGFTDATVGMCISIAAVSAIPLLYVVGKLLDRLGRRRSALVVYAAAILGALGAFTATSRPAVILSLILVIGVGSALVPILNAIATELFPTELRADAYAWSRNLLGRMGMVVTPILIGSCAAHLGWATTLRATVLGPIIALALIWTSLPETSRRELEDTSELRPPPL
jgi:putative MFS transporter